MFYYFLIILSVVMFGGSFAFTDSYQRLRGNSLKISLEFSALTSFFGLIALFLINGFKFEYTHFTLIMAIISSLNGFAFTFCSFRALGKINLSLYSLFSMLGGMVLPSLQGIILYDEKITVAKLICFVLITVALLLTIEKGEKNKGIIYYVGVFVFNGMSGVLSQIYTEAKFEKASAAGYSILISVCSVVMALIFLLFMGNKEKTPKNTFLSTFVGAANGITNKVANFLLVVALAHDIDSSVQYPMVTGGVMIVSTIICFLGKNKPSKKEVLSVFIAFIGLLVLFVIPI